MSSNPLVTKIYQCLPPENWENHLILLACSGGPDSVALLRLVHEISQQLPETKFQVAHVNHQMRGSESTADQDFVQKTCDSLKVPLHCNTLPLDVSSTSDGTEAALRDLRYKWFEKLAVELGARYLLTGHNLNDQTETILFRLMRGTGLAGLSGIPVTRQLCESVTLVRPMLDISREEIIDYLDRIKQSYRVDQSNHESEFTRNKIRNKLLPLIKSEFSPNVDARFSSLATQASEVQKFLNSIVDTHLSGVTFRDGEMLLNRMSVNSLEPVIVRQLLVRCWQRMNWPLSDMTFEKWSHLCGLILDIEKGQTPKMTLPGNISVSFDSEKVTFHRIR